MSIYTPRQGEFGHTGKLRRVKALRLMEQARVIRYEDYIPTNPPQFVIANVDQETRTPTGREVPVYVLGAADLMLALNEGMPDVIDAAMARESVVDRESLSEAILDELNARYGDAIRQAADIYAVPDDVDVLVAAS